MRFERTAAGDLEDPALPALFLGGWITDLHLDFGDARALRRELAQVLERYVGRGGAGRSLLHLRLAPRPEVPGNLSRITLRWGVGGGAAPGVPWYPGPRPATLGTCATRWTPAPSPSPGRSAACRSWRS